MGHDYFEVPFFSKKNVAANKYVKRKERLWNNLKGRQHDEQKNKLSKLCSYKYQNLRNSVYMTR